MSLSLPLVGWKWVVQRLAAAAHRSSKRDGLGSCLRAFEERFLRTGRTRCSKGKVSDLIAMREYIGPRETQIYHRCATSDDGMAMCCCAYPYFLGQRPETRERETRTEK
ncbi:hypothetical protein B0H63DRAFT_71389 [Podospora didyma]|uniref:Uncharacterized protein n=1 Tax=Podospora didyma TaxID=330526 RepID=A0AAE0K177_9PEZI|nr:hypothetical protein B0H63DRAFT_71389 [Podospora didyma]